MWSIYWIALTVLSLASFNAGGLFSILKNWNGIPEFSAHTPHTFERISNKVYVIGLLHFETF